MFHSELCIHHALFWFCFFFVIVLLLGDCCFKKQSFMLSSTIMMFFIVLLWHKNLLAKKGWKKLSNFFYFPHWDFDIESISHMKCFVKLCISFWERLFLPLYQNMLDFLKPPCCRTFHFHDFSSFAINFFLYTFFQPQINNLFHANWLDILSSVLGQQTFDVYNGISKRKHKHVQMTLNQVRNIHSFIHQLSC